MRVRCQCQEIDSNASCIQVPPTRGHDLMTSHSSVQLSLLYKAQRDYAAVRFRASSMANALPLDQSAH